MFVKISPFQAGLTGTPWTSADLQVRSRFKNMKKANAVGAVLYLPCK